MMRILLHWTFFLLLFGGVAPGAAGALEYLAQPYLSNPKPDGITIAWVTKEEAKAELRYGESKAYGRKAQVARMDTSDWKKNSKVFIQKVRLRGLKPGRKYFYEVAGAGLPAYADYFRTVPTDPKVKVLFCFGGDYGQAWPTEQDLAFVAARAGQPVDFFLDVGDHAITRRFRGAWQGHTPVVLAKGNHDNEKGTKDRGGKGQPGQIQHFYDFDGNKLNFSLAWGPLFLVVDGSSPYRPVKAPVFQWIERQFQSTRLPWRIFACHGVFFSDAGHGVKEGAPRAQQLWPLFRKYGVQMQFNGHDHVYQRTDRINKDGQKDPRGTASITFGGTNQGSYWRRKQSAFIAYSYRAARNSGVCSVRIEGDHAKLEFHTRPKGSRGKYQLTDSATFQLSAKSAPEKVLQGR